MRLWQVASGRELPRLLGHAGYVNTVVFSPDSNLLASGSRSGEVKIWDVNNGALAYSLPSQTTGVNNVAHDGACGVRAPVESPAARNQSRNDFAPSRNDNSPFSTQSRRYPNRFFASKAPTSCMAVISPELNISTFFSALISSKLSYVRISKTRDLPSRFSAGT